MTIRVLCDPVLLEGKVIQKVANYWHGSGSSNSFLLKDGSVFGFKQNGESAFFYEGRTFYDANYDKVMDVLGGQAVELGLVSQTMYDAFKSSKVTRERREAEESDRRLYECLKERFEPKAKKEDK
jgi:hypothetical protein